MKSVDIIIFPPKKLGKIEAQTIDGDGKFIARGSESRIQGPSLKVVTKSGDINIESDCYAEECHLISQQGDVRLRNVYDTGKDLFDRTQNPSHLTLYPDVLKK